MQRKFQYIMLGVGLTLLVLIGAFAFLSEQAQAGATSPKSVDPTVETITTNTDHVREQSQIESNDAPIEASDLTGSQLLESNAVSRLGTIDNPVTDMDAIIQTVTEFAQKQEERLLGKTGWLHVKSSLYLPEQMKGNGYRAATTGEIIPMEALVPHKPTFETWYHVDETGAYSEGMGLVSSPDGAIHQQTVFVDGQWINLALKTKGARQEQYQTSDLAGNPLLPNSFVRDDLRERQAWSNLTMQAYAENGQYIVIEEQQYDPPIDNAAFISEPVLSSKEVFAFDRETGLLLWREVQLLPQSGSWFVTEREEYVAVEFVRELPVKESQLLDNAMSTLQEER